jgi:hypothetical protein
MDPRVGLITARAARLTMALRLTMWSGGSMLLGLALWGLDTFLDRGGAWRMAIDALGAECVAWGLLEAGFGLIALRQVQSAGRAPLTDPQVVTRELADRDRLVRALTFCANIVTPSFLLIGIVLVVVGAATNRSALLGHGLGIALHSAFLLFYCRAFRFLLRAAADKAPTSIAAPVQGR